jgi:hypothetical protein
VYFKAIAVAANNKQGVMEFWTDWSSRLPILFRIARRILPTPACSADVERLFSVTGLICTPLRAGLSPAMVNTLASLNLWLKDDYGYKNKRTGKIASSTDRFVTLNADLEFVLPDENADGGEDSSDEEI